MEGRPISRSYSDKYVPGQGEYDLYQNKNVDWFAVPSVKLFYIALVLIAWGLLHMSGFFEIGDCWTITNIVHGVVSELSPLFSRNLLVLPLSFFFPSFIFVFGKYHHVITN